MKISPLLFSVFTLLWGSFVDAAKVEVIQVPSGKMDKEVPATLILTRCQWFVHLKILFV